MGRRGPHPLGYVELRTTITPEMDAALANLARVTGVSKATTVRYALQQWLETFGAVFPTDIEPSISRGSHAFTINERKDT